jgi:hypothetical protein
LFKQRRKEVLLRSKGKTKEKKAQVLLKDGSVEHKEAGRMKKTRREKQKDPRAEKSTRQFQKIQSPKWHKHEKQSSFCQKCMRVVRGKRKRNRREKDAIKIINQPISPLLIPLPYAS